VINDPEVAQTEPAAAATAGGLRARDVVAFGHEVGRILSDGRVIGRAEPFAKVFASSRAVKRAVGAVAWVILEDIALDAVLDERGRLVSDTSVRQIAANLGMNKTTVARHLVRLREYGFVIHEEARDTASGRWQASWYVLDPSACVERFTHTPTAVAPPPDEPCPEHADTANDAAVSASTGHGDTGSGDDDGVLRHRYANPQRQHANCDAQTAIGSVGAKLTARAFQMCGRVLRRRRCAVS
jgi:DNA-binding transcriptional ArsR family regulator